MAKTENINEHKYDIAIIGSGPGGYVAAIRAAQLGLKTVCIEKEKTLGGTCLNVGCIPSKALLQSTEHYEFLQHEANEHGIEYQKLQFNFPQLMQRKDKVVHSLVEGIGGLFIRNKITRVEGTARFISDHAIEVVNGTTKQKIEADSFILATGSESIPLPFLSFDEQIVVSSTGALCLPNIPKKMVVIGGGVIGVELASVYNRLGTEVTIVEMMDRVCPTMDLAISKALFQSLKKQGLKFHLGTTVTKAEKKTKGNKGPEVLLTIVEKEEKKEYQLDADVVLVAIGRRPYSKGLGLKEIGVAMSPKGFVITDDNFRTNLPNIFAIGDLTDGPMLAHRASEEGTAVAELIAGLNPHINYMTIPNVIYTHPEVAAIGLTEQEAKELGIPILVGNYLFKGNPRARCSGYTDGFVKVIGAKSTGRLLGMHIIGQHASEMIGEGVLAMEGHATLESIANASHAHPTLSEAIKEACLQALGRAIHL